MTKTLKEMAAEKELKEAAAVAEKKNNELKAAAERKNNELKAAVAEKKNQNNELKAAAAEKENNEFEENLKNSKAFKMLSNRVEDNETTMNELERHNRKSCLEFGGRAISASFPGETAKQIVFRIAYDFYGVKIPFRDVEAVHYQKGGNVIIAKFGMRQNGSAFDRLAKQRKS